MKLTLKERRRSYFPGPFGLPCRAPLSGFSAGDADGGVAVGSGIGDFGNAEGFARLGES